VEKPNGPNRSLLERILPAERSIPILKKDGRYLLKKDDEILANQPKILIFSLSYSDAV